MNKNSFLDELIYFFRLLNRTRIADKQYYISHKQPISLYRIWRNVFPNLKHPVFIIGAPRSGTTFLGSSLAAIPEISYHYEPIITKFLSAYVYEGKWSYKKAKYIYRQIYLWLMRIHLDGHLRFAEKTPRNSFIIPFLQEAFPDASIIHIIRDGRDVALSLSKKPWLQQAYANSGRREPGGYYYGPYARFWVEKERISEFESTTDIHRCIWSWRRHVEAALNAASTLSPIQYHEVRYESLVKNPQYEGERLLDFLKITNSDSRDMFLNAINKIHGNSLGRWRRELTDKQLDQIMMEAGKLLELLGYK